VEVYRTEQEQVEALKKWWSENGSTIVISIAVAVAVIFGWQAWQDHRRNTVDSASIAYSELLEALDRLDQNQVEPDKAKKDELIATAEYRAKSLKAEHEGTVYATYASLLLAAKAVNQNDLDGALKELDAALASTKDENLHKLITLRTARVKFAQAKFDDALSTVSNDGGIFQSAYEQLKGDIHLEKGERDQARQAYKNAQEHHAKSSKTPDRLLDMKLKSVEQADASMIADLPAKK